MTPLSERRVGENVSIITKYLLRSILLHSDSRPRIRTGGEERDKKIVVLIYRYVQISIRDNFIRRK